MTQKQIQIARLDPQYKAYLENKADLYVAKRISIAYILFSVANSYVEEANDKLAEYNLVHKKIKTTVNNMMQSFDAYDNVIRKLLHAEGVNTQEIGNQLCMDFDTMRELCDKFMNEEPQKEDGTPCRKD